MNCDTPVISQLVSADIIEEENDAIVTWPTKLELKATLLSIPSYSSPVLDRFGLDFFVTCWDFIKEDLLEAAQDFIVQNPNLKI